MSDSSIPVSSEFREELEEMKRDGESYEAYLKRQGVLESDSSDRSDGSDGLTESDKEEIEAIVDRRAKDLETTIPAKTAEELGRQFR